LALFCQILSDFWNKHLSRWWNSQDNFLEKFVNTTLFLTT